MTQAIVRFCDLMLDALSIVDGDFLVLLGVGLPATWKGGRWFPTSHGVLENVESFFEKWLFCNKGVVAKRVQ